MNVMSEQLLSKDWRDEWRKQYGAHSLCEQMIRDIELIIKGRVERYIENSSADYS